MALPLEKPRYTYADYLTWDESERIELIDGEPVLQTAPLRIHQKISMEISIQLGSYLRGKTCAVYAAPFTVRLFEKKEDTPEDVQTVVQPDFTVICDPSKLDKYGCKGAPDMIIEILSPATARYDSITKLNKYQQAGVKEYWIINPEKQTTHVYCFEDGLFTLNELYSAKDTIKVNILEDCSINLSQVFLPEGE